MQRATARTNRTAGAVIAAAAALFALAACGSSGVADGAGAPTGRTSTAVTDPSQPRATASSTVARTSPAETGRTTKAPARPVDARSALALLATVAVKGRAPKTGYTRAAFGPAWTDDNGAPRGHNGCDTRNDILRRDLTHLTLKPDTAGCTVLTGTLHDPYSNVTIAFQRGTDTSTAVQIDHVVALSDAWQTGAQYWDADKRRELANDPLELLAVDGPTNESKGDGDAATWLPPNKSFRCAYVARQVAVKARYGLWMTAAERDAIAGVLSACPGQAAPTEPGTAPTSGRTSPPAPASTPHPATSARAPAVPTSSNVYYANCTAVRAAGKAPLLRGQPGYRSGLDRDKDGVACES